MSTLDDVIIYLRCKYCYNEFSISAYSLMKAGIEGPPTCDCKDGEAEEPEVVDIKIEDPDWASGVTR